MRALIGHSGFVGGTLLRQRAFDSLFNSRNVEELKHRGFQSVVCAGLPAAKWIANRDPDADMRNIAALCEVLRTVEAETFVLISTIDAYPKISGVDESFDCHAMDNNPYGAHRLFFEDFVRDRFPSCFILRLPGLFGRGLKKNVIYDLLHDNCLEAINPKSSFQWYDLDRLADDIETAIACRLSLVGLMPEPVVTQEILDRFFPGKAVGDKAGPEVHYDVRTRHAAKFGGSGDYLMDAEEVLARLGRFVGSELAAAAS